MGKLCCRIDPSLRDRDLRPDNAYRYIERRAKNYTECKRRQAKQASSTSELCTRFEELQLTRNASGDNPHCWKKNVEKRKAYWRIKMHCKITEF